MAVRVEINAVEIAGEPGDSLFELAEAHGIRVPTSCLKQGKCRECLVEVVEGGHLLSPREPAETHLEDKFRLSCRARLATADQEPHGSGCALRCHTMRRGEMKILDQATALPCQRSGSLDPAVSRDGRRIFVGDREIAHSNGPLHGLAMDLGTTTVVLRLVDLATGRLVASSSFENPQRFGGSDVMSRIRYDSDHGGRLLQRILLGYLAREISALPVDAKTIYELVVVGNATMRDLFFGLDVETIGQKPYRSITEHEWLNGQRESTAISTDAKRLRLPIHPNARVVGLPLVGCHIGSDVAAGLLTIDLACPSGTVALMDIGTNTEIVVRHENRMLAASCPAGPAFEGGSITHGMPALIGAVERVNWQADGSIRVGVIGDVPAAGICGSGLIDALGELRRVGKMNEMGRFPSRQPIVLDETQQISLSENDVSELAQAKGAAVAGWRIVLHRCGLHTEDIERLYLAGGFAGHLDTAAARRIGLIPNVPDTKLELLGNAAIEGATYALISRRARERLSSLVSLIEHVELETDPRFFDYFVDGCQFREVD